MNQELAQFIEKFVPNCEFNVEIRQACEDTRDWNYLDYLFYWDSETYSELCKWCDEPNPTPSQLMRALDSKRGIEVKVITDDQEFTGIFDLTDNYEIIIKDCKRA